jgi:release factor glutamine methyltransferase
MRSRTTKSAASWRTRLVSEERSAVIDPTVTPVGAALRDATARLHASSDTPRLDAELLLTDVLGCGRERLILDRDLPLEPAYAERFAALLARRQAREPIAYILGRREFRYLTLTVDRRVLIPRPETELLVEAALELPCGASVLDVGTGSGAIALACKDERPDLQVTGSDVSEDALALARANGERLALDVRWVCADLLTGLGEDFDALLANLPYVAESERAALAPEILRHEPPGALFAGADGLSQIRALLLALASRPRVSTVALEVGAAQAEAVAALVTAAGFAEVACMRDLAGIARVVTGVRQRR